MDVTHPSGAKGRFEFAYIRHGRSGTPASACTVDFIDYEQGIVYQSLKLPDYSYTYSLWKKTIEGPGLSPMIWTYEWEDPTTGRENFGGSYCSFCDPDKAAFVTEPDGTRKEYIFGALWNLHEGRLLATHTRAPSGALLRSEVLTYVTEAEIQAGVPFPPLHGDGGSGDSSVGLYNRPVKETAITQDGRTFRRKVEQFDHLARPVTVRLESSQDQ